MHGHCVVHPVVVHTGLRCQHVSVDLVVVLVEGEAVVEVEVSRTDETALSGFIGMNGRQQCGCVTAQFKRYVDTILQLGVVSSIGLNPLFVSYIVNDSVNCIVS